ENYIAHGFMYPFFHSSAELIDFPPTGYSASKAETLLSAYQDAGIPADRQINIIAVMREAYADFSQYGLEGLSPDCYTLYHQLEAESYTGDLVTNIFAGGTIDTERCFLTGNYKLKNYRADTNSYLWYLREQGYTVEGSHPYYQWFYNRQNVNGYLGFERYRFWEGDYEHLTDAVLPEDAVLYPEVYADFEANKATGKPYFSFVLNVQSHGPYATGDYYGSSPEYLSGNYSDECRNAMNNYLSSIMNSDIELMNFIDRLRTDPDPVVLITFGDHLPWMGNQGVFYNEMGINVDTSTEEGFFTHYSTRYLIWANDAAVELLGHEIRGTGPRISPCYLMGLLFRQLGWEGPAYMQALDSLMDVIPVASETDHFVIDGVLTDGIPPERQDLCDSFLFLQYYWRSKWLYQGCV
ncbi:MAG: LTA synthase family protein, partial [Oscillospiraceae bacterium]|nr:LTA synthase family protein [Oscillospiraceae bacterium]